jgi:TDG/mug DNA glycosylase family protein
MVPNDFRGFLRAHPSIHAIFFNGAKAEKIYNRYVQPTLPDDLRAIRTIRLPSTSPANAAIPFEVKLCQWKVIQNEREEVIPVG